MCVYFYMYSLEMFDMCMYYNIYMCIFICIVYV